jgi:hypothetical protein
VGETKGELRKRLEVELGKNLGMKATKEQIAHIRKTAAILSS